MGPVVWVRDYCFQCDEEHEIEVCLTGCEHRDRDSQGRVYTVSHHATRCLGPRGGDSTAFYLPGELDALVRGFSEQSA